MGRHFYKISVNNKKARPENQSEWVFDTFEDTSMDKPGAAAYT